MTITINNRTIGPGHPTYVVAEMSANHNHDFARAEEIVRAAKDAGADAVKVQTYTPDTLTIDCDNEHFRIAGTLWEGKTLHELYSEAYTPWDWQPRLKDIANDIGLDFFSTPFDATAVDFLQDIGVPAYKVASFELVDLPLLRCVAATGKPIILSTGMSTQAEIEEAAAVIRATGNNELALLKCTSAYPARPEEMNLRTIPDLADRYGVPVGLSDHTTGTEAAVAAVALGACIVEKHFTLSRSAPGPDAAFSAEPEEFRALVQAIRVVEKARGEARYGPTDLEKSSLVFRRSLFVVDDMSAGDKFTDRNVRSIRPGVGMHTRHLAEVIGRTAARAIPRGTPLSWDLVSRTEPGDRSPVAEDNAKGD